MFAIEDFNLDEDFLNDVSQKESEYYSQVFSSDEENSVKRYKKDNNSSRPSCSKSLSNLVEPIDSNFGGERLVPNANDFIGDRSNRRNLILERLKRSKNTNSDQSIKQRTNKTNSKSKSSNPGTSRLTPEPETRDLQTFRGNNVKSLLASTHSPENKPPPDIIEDVNSSSSKVDHRSSSRKSPFKTSKLFNKPVTLVRQFPGPAGLLRNLSSGIIPPISLDSSCYNNSNDGTDIDVDENSSLISKYCSQNTINSFTEGPWQLLMNDLGHGFLEGHEISNIKQRALTNSYKNDKVPYLAGVVQRVNFNRHDPLIVLKDYSDTIEGTICKDILLEYPQLLDVGVVLLLRNVGLLTVGNYQKKCHVIITLKNIVNVFTEKSKIFSKPEMEARLENLNKHNYLSESVLHRELGGSCLSNSEMGERPKVDRVNEKRNIKPILRPSVSKNTCVSVSNSGKFASANLSKSYNSAVSKTSTYGCKNLFADNHETIHSFQAKSNLFESTEQKSKKFTFETEEFKDFDDDFAASFCDLDDGMASETPTNSDLARNTKTGESGSVSISESTLMSGENIVNLNTRLSDQTKQLVSKPFIINNEKGKKNQVKVPSAAEENRNLPKRSSVELKLSVFRSKAELTPPASDDLDLKTHKQDKAENKSSFKSGLVLTNENDSDEELFSQVDIESIFSRYDSTNDVN